MKLLKDLLALLYFLGLLLVAILFFPVEFKALTKSHPYLMGFLKVSLLATFGEYLKKRLTSGDWKFDSFRIFVARFFVWGVFGIWFTAIFPLFSLGVDSIVSKGLWPNFENPLWIPFSKSLWINVIGCFGWTMMLTHEWFNFSIERRKPQPLVEFSKNIDSEIWFSLIPKTIILFWLPAHTITFALPSEWRILMAATLSVVLGFILTIKK